jgi:peptidoglycan hydrolase-like protein with peptidoglycan-binding domain
LTSKKKISSSKKKPAGRIYGKQTQPDAARSREIQEALQREGFLKSEPSGKWDAATTDAFSRYQTAHGVRATGKPDARSLFSLGLGPKYPPQTN